MPERAGAAGAADRRRVLTEQVRLEVERLDHTGSDAGARVLRAAGRAWAAVPVRLGVPVLVAGSARISPAPGAQPLTAGPDGPRWAADFRVPEPVVLAADSWAVETGLPTEAEPEEAEPAEEGVQEATARLQESLATLREADRVAAGLEARAAELATLAATTREADARRLALAEGARREGERLLGAATAEREEAEEARLAAEEALRSREAEFRSWIAERDAHAAERADSARRLDAALAERDQARERAATATAEQEQVEARWRAAVAEVRELRAALEAASGDREQLERRLGLATRERDELRGRIETSRARGALPLVAPPESPEPAAPPEPSQPPELAAPPEPPEPSQPSQPSEPPTSPEPAPEPPLAPADAQPSKHAFPRNAPPPPRPPEPTVDRVHRDDAVDGPTATSAPVARRSRVKGRAGAIGIGVLAGAGTLLVTDAVITLLWQEPLSALFSAREQSRLEDDLTTLDARLPTAAPAPAPRQTAQERMAQLAITLRSRADPGDAIGKLSIPRLGSSWVVVQGSGTGQLRKGPGHYSSTSLPGRPGTTAVAGHRTTFGAPFRRVNELESGDKIVMRMPYGTFGYRVEGTRVVKPEDVSVLRDIGRPRLVLTACEPLYSAEKRIVVFARLTSATPRGTRRAQSS